MGKSVLFAVVLFIFLCIGSVVQAALLDPQGPGLWGVTRSDDYALLVGSLTANDHVVTTIGDKMWVPWYATSSSCTVDDLQKDDNCNAGQVIDFSHNCMVTDEFSQVGILVAMGDSEVRMEQFYNTVLAIRSSFGSLPAWRVYRDGDVIEACKQDINDNCDTASDATARIMISLFTGGKNSQFSDHARQRYTDLAKVLAFDFVTYEVKEECRPTNFGSVCHWLAAGSRAKEGGMTSTDFAYTGYFGDAIIAMLAACKETGDMSYCGIARDFALNYLQASRFDGIHFTTPPGRSFRWKMMHGQPTAECTNTCGPARWDSADASRAVGVCQANYYAEQMGFDIGMAEYCGIWGEQYMGDPSIAPIQYYPDGEAVDLQSGYFAQGLQALFQSGGNNPALFGSTLDNALLHFSTATMTWDYQSCFGVYMQAPAVRALGFGIGLDQFAFSNGGEEGPFQSGSSESEQGQTCPISVQSMPVTCNGLITDDFYDGCRQISCSKGDNEVRVLACDKPDQGKKQYFEMYKKSQKGNGVRICIGSTCVQEDGFAKSPNYPVCQAIETPIAVEEVGVEDPSGLDTAGDQLDTDIRNLAFTVLPEGSLVGDYPDGDSCRKVQYNTPFGWVEAKACAKDSQGSYELYLLSSPNDASICMSNNCVGKSSGFVAFTS